MKRILLLSFFLSFCLVQAQFNQDAPWMKNLNVEQRRSSNPVTFNEIVDAFNTYWENRDPNVKGSGYKPFKRWEVFWENFVKKDGSIPTQQELWNTWLAYRAQEQNKSSLVDLSNWQPVGPFNHVNTGSWSSGQGRVNAIIVDPIVSTTFYGGAPAGGLWKSTDSGTTWATTTDQLPQIGVSGIAIDYNDSNIIYIATGDDDAGDSYSVGVMKSIDGGATWNTTDLDTSNSPTSMNDIYMNPDDSDMLWVATNGGVYKTVDGGVNWIEKLNGNIKDIKLKPGDPSKIYAVTTNTLYISTDFGETFADISSGLPASSSRLVIDVTPANPDVVYVLSSLSNNFQGIYKSSNSGLTFTEQDATLPNASDDLFDGSSQAYYDMALAVSDTDENEIYVGVLNIWKSIDGGTNFTKLNSWSAPSSPSYTHADIHLLRFYNSELFAGTDGGFYKSSNGGTNFTDLTAGMQIGQFYRITVSNESSQKMVGGLQDNGGFALNAGQWQVYYGADGMDTAIDRYNSDLYYGFTQYGGSLNISTSSGGSLNNQVGAPSDETGSNDSGGNWITPLVMSKTGEMYAGYSKLYKFCGGSWQAISSSFGSDIDVLEIDDLNTDNIYVGLDKVLWKSTDGGFNFSNLETFTSNITSIEVNNNDSNIVYITTSGSGGKVFKKTGAAKSIDITGSLPNVTKNVVKHQNLHSLNPLFLGTSLGVYRYDDVLGDWELFENNLPTVSVRDLELTLNDEDDENIITAATYGRGIWQSSIPTETLTNELRLENIENLDSSLGCDDISGIQAYVKNLGTNTVNSIDVEYILNGVSNSFTWSDTSLSTNEYALIDIPTLSPTGSNIQELKIITTIAGDAYSSNNQLMKKFYTNSLGLVNMSNSFETENDELIVSDGGICGYWERGVPNGTLLDTAASGDNVYGTNLNGNHADLIKTHLVSKCYDLSILTNPIIKFNMAYDLEQDFDIVYVEYSTDSGANWNVLGTASDPNWYNSDRTYGSSGGQDCQNCPGAQWTGTDATMKEYSYDLAALGSETNIIFRFVFHSDPAENQEGVVIDDFVIEGTLSAEPFDTNYFSIYPNPSKDVFNIRMAAINEFDYDLYDITGKLIYQEQNIIPTNREYQLDLTNLSSGIYLLKIISDGYQTTKKLILK